LYIGATNLTGGEGDFGKIGW